MNRTLTTLLVGLVAGTCLLGRPAAAETVASARVPRILEEDVRLRQPVTLSRVGCSLAAVLQQLGDLVDVELSAAPEVAERRLVLRITERTAKEVMYQLAMLCDTRWRRKGVPDAFRYELYQDLASQQKEQALRRESLHRALAGLQEALRERLELSARPMEALREEIAGYDILLARLEQLPAEEREAAERSPTVRRLLERAALRARLCEVADPERRALIGVVSSLTPVEWDALVQGATLRRLIRWDLSDRTERTERTVAQVGVRLALTRVAGCVQAALSVAATPVGAAGYGGETPPSRALMVVGYSPATIEPDPATAASRERAEEPCLGSKRRLALPRRVSGEDREVTFSLGRLLTAIVESYGVDLVAAVDPEQRVEEPGPGEERSLREVLEYYVSPHAVWSVDGDVLRVRRHESQP